jgi:hypothetical protein
LQIVEEQGQRMLPESRQLLRRSTAGR